MNTVDSKDYHILLKKEMVLDELNHLCFYPAKESSHTLSYEWYRSVNTYRLYVFIARLSAMLLLSPLYYYYYYYLYVTTIAVVYKVELYYCLVYYKI